MTITIQPSGIEGNAIAPPSKSVAQRALAVAWLRRGTTVLRNTGHSADEQAVISVLAAAGCILEEDGPLLKINSSTAASVHTADIGESGLAARMLAPLLALQPEAVTLQGRGSLLRRPMDALQQALTRLDVACSSANGYLPLTVKGPLQPRNITVDGSVSSQVITGLIMAYSAAGAAGVSIAVDNPVSTPYLALTLKVMEDMQVPVPVAGSDYASFRFTGKKASGAHLDYTIEGDWSSAAFLAVAGAIAGDLSIRGLDVFTAQGDKAVLQALMDAGVQLSITVEEIIVRRSSLKAFHFNATDHPDLFPPLAVLAAYCKGTSVIEGVHRLIHKESNRAVTLQEELGKMGIAITFQEDMMLIEGGRPVTGGTVSARGDHRIAMACTVAALGADGPTIIEGAEAVQKSWPGFFKDLTLLGANIKTT